MRLKISRGLFTLIDREDFKRVNAEGKWFANQRGRDGIFYAARNGKYLNGKRGKKIYLQNFILGFPKNKVVDHINLDTLDNRKSNLRVCSRSENLRNKSRYSNNKSGYKGVAKRKNGYYSYIRKNNKRFHLGVFKTAKGAAEKYDAIAIQKFGKFARLNFPKK